MLAAMAAAIAGMTAFAQTDYSSMGPQERSIRLLASSLGEQLPEGEPIKCGLPIYSDAIRHRSQLTGTQKAALNLLDADENDFSGNLGCCGAPGVGGGHIASIVITKHGKPLKSAKPMTHYSMLATIEQGFGLPLLANAKTANTMWDLFPDRDDDDHFGH